MKILGIEEHFVGEKEIDGTNIYLYLDDLTVTTREEASSDW
jgi:hypothetical protein